MTTRKKNNEIDVKVEIGLNENTHWDAQKLASLKKFIKKESVKRTPGQILKNELLAIQYQMEEYIADESINNKKIATIETFLQDYLKVLNLTFKRFSNSIDTSDGNLKKYLSGSRKFNIDLAMKFGHFFHTPPDLWLKVHIKNELIELNKIKKLVSRYKKYDYEKELTIAS